MENKQKLFNLCCLALTVTSMTFAIRAGILGQLGIEYGLSSAELGWVNAMAFLGFPLATMIGGAIYNAIGARNLLSLAFACHLLGLLLTISADGFWGLLISTFLIGFANGAVEAGCNPLVAELYAEKKASMLNKFHVWFPGGIVIGALLSNMMTGAGISWHYQVAVIILPTLMYGYLLLKSNFPAANSQLNSTKNNLGYLFTPMYLFLVFCMIFTATTELGTQQWIERILAATGASPMLVLALISGVMAVGRFFAGPIIKQFNITGVLLISSIIASLGIFIMSIAQGNQVYVAAILFAIGCTYFWPTMLAAVAELCPNSGALGMSMLGGAGMFAVSMWNPVIGGWIDSAQQQSNQLGLSAEQSNVFAGQVVLENLLVFPLILIVAFVVLHVITKKRYLSSNNKPLAQNNNS